MKKRIIFMMVFAIVFAAGIFASVNNDSTDTSVQSPLIENAVSTNVWPWLGSFFNIGYERAIGNSFSLRPRAFFWGLSNLGAKWALFGFGLDAFWHPMGKGLSGWFLGPRYDIWILSVDDGAGNKGTGTGNLIGAMFGYRWVFEGGFELGIALGGQGFLGNIVVNATSGSNSTTTTYAFPYKGVLPAFDTEIGWAF